MHFHVVTHGHFLHVCVFPLHPFIGEETEVEVLAPDHITGWTGIGPSVNTSICHNGKGGREGGGKIIFRK